MQQYRHLGQPERRSRGARDRKYHDQISKQPCLHVDGLACAVSRLSRGDAVRLSQQAHSFHRQRQVGGGNDLFARLVVQKFQQNTGATVVIENKVGAGGRIATDYAAHQPADGYTVLVGATGQMSIAAAIYPNLNYHPTKSFIALNMIASFPLVLVVPANHEVKTLKQLVVWAKTYPDKSNYATASPSFTIASELFKLKTGMPASRSHTRAATSRT